ncbi:MAG: hypothetical protein ACRDSE_13205 [Pseudonocardiaceae bacterium]
MTTADTALRLRRGGAAALRLADHPQHGVGVYLPYSGFQFWGRLIGLVVTVICVLILTIGTAIDDSGSFRSLNVVNLALALATAALATYLVQVARGKRARGHLHLSRRGLYQRHWTYEAGVSWDDIAQVRPLSGEPGIIVGSEDILSRRIDRLWLLRSRMPTRSMHITGSDLAADPALVLALVLFYANHPEARHELGTEDALQRARAAAFT